MTLLVRESELQQRVANFRDPRAPVPLAYSTIALLGSGHDDEKKEKRVCEGYIELVQSRFATRAPLASASCLDLYPTYNLYVVCHVLGCMPRIHVV